MLKRLCLALAGLFAFLAVANAAGTVPGFSLTPQFDLSGKVAPGCKLYIIQAGTTSTPQNAYQDSALTLLQPNPMICDAGGRLGQFFVADGVIKLRLTTSTGTQIFVGDNLLVVGSSSGGGGGGTVDPTTILATGDFKQVYNTGVLSGFVRCNGRTVGSATSGATERANADTSALFAFLWGADSNLAVSGGRGASAAADYAANKTIALPDCRGRVLAGLDDMGNSAASRLTSSYFGATGTTLGASGGGESHTLIEAELPALSKDVSGLNSGGAGLSIDSAAASYLRNSTGVTTSINSGSGATTIYLPDQRGFVTTTLPHSFVAFGSGNAHNVVQPTILLTTYIKL
jgi:microcystin-dependent protein